MKSVRDTENIRKWLEYVQYNGGKSIITIEDILAEIGEVERILDDILPRGKWEDIECTIDIQGGKRTRWPTTDTFFTVIRKHRVWWVSDIYRAERNGTRRKMKNVDTSLIWPYVENRINKECIDI